jgi:hypothetical protein
LGYQYVFDLIFSSFSGAISCCHSKSRQEKWRGFSLPSGLKKMEYLRSTPFFDYIFLSAACNLKSEICNLKTANYFSST